MREKSPDLQNLTESKIVFSDQDFRLVDEQFANACMNHGDGSFFKWTAGGGEYDYSILRVSVNCARSLGATCRCWELVQKDHSGNVDIAIISIKHQFLDDVFGKTLAHKLVNDAYAAAIDLADENRDLDSRYKYLFREDSDGVERRIINPDYVSPAL